jgi:hypothetical protein
MASVANWRGKIFDCAVTEYPRQTPADISGGFGMDDAVRQHLFPILVFVGGQVLHREHRPVLLLIKDFRYAFRHECPNGPEPGGFKRVALDGCMPIRRDAKLG